MASTTRFGSCTFLVLGLLFEAVIVASASAESSATLTTLPPASPTGDSSDPCNFTNRYSLIDRVAADWRGYNVSLLVATCEGVCPLVFGSGNPDISGIGAMISYIIQAIVVFVFGPLLALSTIIYDFDLSVQLSEPQDRRSRLFGFAGKLSRSFQTSNILTSLSVLIASIIRIPQLAPLAELTFIKFLATYQYLMVMAASTSYLVTFGGNSAQFAILAFYFAATTGTFVAIHNMDGYPSSKVTILNQITWYCISDWDYPVPDLMVDDALKGLQASTRAGLSVSVACLVLLVAGLLMHYFWAWLERIHDKFVALCERFHLDSKRVLIGLAVSSLTVMWVSYCIVLLLGLQQQRRHLQLVSGNAYQDSQWGFGQITAVLLWWPMCHDTILGIFGTFRTEHPPMHAEDVKEIQPLHAPTSLQPPIRTQSTNLRDLNAQVASSATSRAGTDNNIRHISPETPVGGEQGETHINNTTFGSSSAARSEHVAAPTYPPHCSPTKTSPSGEDSRPTLERTRSNHQEGWMQQRLS